MAEQPVTPPRPGLEGKKPPTTEELIKLISGTTPHSRELGLEVVHSARGMAIMRLPWHERLVGNPDEMVMHGGVVTTLLDSVCGMATMSARQPPERIVTLDLRIDYQRPATPESRPVRPGRGDQDDPHHRLPERRGLPGRSQGHGRARHRHLHVRRPPQEERRGKDGAKRGAEEKTP